MVLKSTALACLTLCALILTVACGSASTPSVAKSSPISAHPDVLVTFDGNRHACVVALPSEAQGSEVACKEIVSFIRDELRRRSGSTYEVRQISDFSPAEKAKAESALKEAGYLALGGSVSH